MVNNNRQSESTATPPFLHLYLTLIIIISPPHCIIKQEEGGVEGEGERAAYNRGTSLQKGKITMVPLGRIKGSGGLF